MLRFGTLFLLAAFAFSAAAQTPSAWKPPQGTQTLRLWPDGPPGHPQSPGPEKDITTSKDRLVAGKPILHLTDVSDPTITVFAPPGGKQTGTAVLVFPGGSYRVLTMDLSGTEICHWLNSLGITAVLLKYRVPNSGPYPKSNAAFEDAERAVSLVRSHAEQWHIDPHRIGVIGFSAGAHLAAVVSNLYERRIYTPVDAADSVSCRPDFTLILYPGWLRKGEQDLAVSPALEPAADGLHPNGPPTFLAQAEDDPVHVENSLAYFWALKKAKIPAEMHLFPHGGHGYGLRATGNPTAAWPELAAVWLHTIGVLK